MMLQPLVQNRAVLDFCGGETILPIQGGKKGTRRSGSFVEQGTLPQAHLKAQLTDEEQSALEAFLTEFSYKDVHDKRAGGKRGMTSSAKFKYPLHSAVSNKRIEMVRILLIAGAPAGATDSENRTPLDLAKSKNPNNSDSALNEIADLLILSETPVFAGIEPDTTAGEATKEIQAGMEIINRFIREPQEAVAEYAGVLDSTPASRRGGDQFNYFQDASIADLGNSATLATLTKTLSIGVSLLNLWAAEAHNPQVLQVAEAFGKCLELVKVLPRPLLMQDSQRHEELQKEFTEFLSKVWQCVRDIEPGGVGVVPIGWLRASMSRAEGEEMSDDGGHCLLMVIARPFAPKDKAPEKEEAPKVEEASKDSGEASKDEEAPKDAKAAEKKATSPDEKWTVGIVNTGDGLQYHPVSAAGTAPHPAMVVRQSPLILTDVPSCTLLQSYFWYLVYRQIVYPSESNGAEILYDTLLPALNKKPLSANFGTEPDGWVTHLPTPVTGDSSFALCFERAVRFAFAAKGFPAGQAAWSGVELRCNLITSMKQALHKAQELNISLSAGERAFCRMATRSLARCSGECTSQYPDQVKEADLEKVKTCIEETESCIIENETAEESAWSLLPMPLIAGEIPKTEFDNLKILLRQDVEVPKEEEYLPRTLVPALTAMMPMEVKTPQHAAATVRLTAHLLTLLVNQQDQISHSVPARFALVVHLVTRLLPMPLPLDHPQKGTKCFWAQKMLYETKADLAKHICLISHHFAAVAFTVRAKRESDGARVMVAAALAVLMDALIRQPVEYLAYEEDITPAEQLISSQMSLHYSGNARGPGSPFGLDLGDFERQSESLLLLSPEYASLRALVLDYFRSTSESLDKHHVIFKFDRSMQCSDGDRQFVGQVGLSLGIGDAFREAHLLMTGERPDLLELYPELRYFRDVVFLWKMLLLPVGEGPPQQNWRANDSVLHWKYNEEDDHFYVHGFEMDLCAKMDIPEEEEETEAPWWLRVFTGGGYNSQKKALSGASPSVLTNSKVETEDDVLHLDNLPTFNNMLGPADSELLLTYLTAPYIRVPLILGFFTNKEHISLLREPQLQAVLDAALFEPGPWCSTTEASYTLPDMIPASNRKHLKTPVGLLFNELLKSPTVVLNAVLSMLRTAFDKDNGQPDSANEGLILYLIRVAVRVESYLLFIIQHIRKDAYLLRSGAHWHAKVPGLLGLQEGQYVIKEFEESHKKLRQEITDEIDGMLQNWLKQSMQQKEGQMKESMIAHACRAQAHLALLYKNISPEEFGVREVAILLSAQLYLNMNHRFANIYTTEATEAQYSLGASEFELFDTFESKRTAIASWLRKRLGDEAKEVFEKVEQVVTGKGTVDELFPGQSKYRVRDWVELSDQPGNFVPKVEAPKKEELEAERGEPFDHWLQRTSQKLSTSASLISVNLGMYKTQQAKNHLIPDWAVQSQDYMEAFGKKNVICIDKETSADRSCKDLVGQRHEIQRWNENAKLEDIKFSSMRKYQPGKLEKREQWLSDTFEPVRQGVQGLSDLELYLKTNVPNEEHAEVWLIGELETRTQSAGRQLIRTQRKEVMVQRSPPLVEVYNVIEYGRQFYNTLIFSSNALWSFHTPSNGDSHPLHDLNPTAPVWTLASGDVEEFCPPTPSVITYRMLNHQLGRQMYMPPRLLRGLLPEALIERYVFWRSENSSDNEGLLIGDEKKEVDSPTRIKVHISKVRSWKVEETSARVERWVLKRGQDGTALLECDVDESKGAEVLVNLRKSLPRLATLLARLENLSHVLVWIRPGTDSGGSLDALHKVELPRLHLSFRGGNGHLYCNQHSGYWVVESKCTAAVELLTQWGGGTLLLENAAGELMVLASAIAKPIIPAACGADVGSVEKCLPGQLMFQRGEESWLSNVSEGSRHHYYELHLTGTFVFTPTFAAKLYLMLCRFASWHFDQVAIAAQTLSEVLTTEEKQLWDHLKYFESGRHADAIACRLRLTIAAESYGPAATPPWDLKTELLAYVQKRHLVSVNCALSCKDEMKLLRSLSTSVMSQNVDLRVRLAVLEQMEGSSAEPTSIDAHLGTQLDDIGFERIEDSSFRNPPGNIEGAFKGMEAAFGHTGMGFESKHDRGITAVRVLDTLFMDPKGGLASIGVASWWWLYELFTGTRTLVVLEGDESASLASFLLRLWGRHGTQSIELSVLRALDLNPEVRSTLPQYGKAGVRKEACEKLKLAWEKKQIKLTSGNYPTANPSKESFTFVPAEILKSSLAWTGPITMDLSASEREFRNIGEHFDRRPLEQIAAAFVEESENRGEVASTRQVKQEIDKIDLPTFSGKRTMKRLHNDLNIVLQRPTRQVKFNRKANLAILKQDLSSLKQKDLDEMNAALGKIELLANKGTVSNWLCRRGGNLANITVGMVIRALLAHSEESNPGLRRANPQLTDDDISSLFDEAAQMLCRTVRIGQISRVQAAVHRLEKSLRASQLQRELMEQAVARELSAARQFTQTGPSSMIKYEPRLLVFEFLFNLILRDSQVNLMKTFCKCIEDRQSKCHQMIMGAGKTTVITPLLAILLADGERLVVACMPQELLALSRSVLMEKFSAAVLPKPVLTLHFERFSTADDALLAKLNAAKLRRAIVVAAPNSLKSLLLKQVELLNQLDMARRYSSAAGGAFEPPPRRSFFNIFGPRTTSSQRVALTPEEIEAKTSEVITCNKIYKMFHSGSMLMDEVDLLLDPRKSELNWPLGAKVSLDLTDASYMTKKQEGLRYKLPFHLLDILFAARGHKMTMPYSDRQEAADTLKALTKAIDEGEKLKRLQKRPHLIVLSVDFYRKELMPLIARWACFFLEQLVRGKVRIDELQRLLQEPELPKESTEKLRAVDDFVIKLLNLTRDWLHVLLPHVLGKVHRVSYGLLVGEDLSKAPAGTPQSRKFLAIPFVGKDRPSSMSEFQHPDITIGLTILAYRYNSLRQDDMKILWKIMIDEMKVQNNLEYHRRDACRDYVHMVTQAGSMVRGFTADGKWVKDLEGENQSHRAGASFKLWPLESVDIADPEQMRTLYDLLSTSAHSVRYFLDGFVFRSDSGILESNSNQLSASGQELAGSQLFEFCLGFSGTPNDLLPKSMGQCAYADGDDGEILAVLGSLDVVSAEQHDHWTPEGLLNIIASSRGDHGPKYHALIDTGALITGMTNYEVAEYLLKQGLSGIEGVIFLDSHDERMVLVRNGMRVMHLAQCGLSPEERFTFYDHVHTTGMDIAQPLTCTACLTVSKDMTFRDYSQGAYRMRGIGKGQCIEVFLTPEVNSLMNNTLARLERKDEAKRKDELERLHRRGSKQEWTKCIILDLIKWLIVNGIQGEDKRHLLLCQQSVENVWRRAASSYLELAPATIWPDWMDNEATKIALNVLRNRVDTQISNKLETAGEDGIKEKLRKDIFRHNKESALLWPDPDKKTADREEGLQILAELQGDEVTNRLDLETSQVREQEIEQETEQEQEREQQQQQEMERDNEKLSEAPAQVQFWREPEKLNQWPLKSLAPSGWSSALSSFPSSLPFYKISELQINTSMLSRVFSPLGNLPGYVLVSDNYYRKGWLKTLRGTRRLKNIICFLEWVPNARNLKRLEKKAYLSEEQKAQIEDAFHLYDTEKSGSLGDQQFHLLLKDIGLGRESEKIRQRYTGQTMTLAKIQEEIALQSFYMMQDGRYYVILTLEEAEHLRASMHLLNEDLWSHECGLAMRCIGNLESALRDSLIDSYGEVHSTVEQRCQLEAAEQLLRFTNNSMGFQREEISMLLRLLFQTDVQARKDWWLGLRECRRRSRRPLEQLPVASVFNKADEFEDLPTKALLSSMRWAFKVLNMNPADAFSKLDTNNSGELSRQEIQKGLQWIQQLVAPQWYWTRHLDALFEFIDEDGSGAIGKEEFKAAMQVDEKDKLLFRLPKLPDIQDGPEVVDLEKVAEPDAYFREMKPSGRFKIYWERDNSLKCIWNTHGTGSEEPLAIWAPTRIGDVATFNVTEAICLGHLICKSTSLEPPEKGVLVLNVHDKKSHFLHRHRHSLNHFLENIMPHPVNFRLAWKLMPSKQTDSTLYIWQPVPRSDNYVALGCLATTEEEKPPLDAMRCVPKEWTKQAQKTDLRGEWDDKGHGGTAAAFWRRDTQEPMAFFDITTGRETAKPPEVWAMNVSESDAAVFYAEMPPW